MFVERLGLTRRADEKGSCIYSEINSGLFCCGAVNLKGLTGDEVRRGSAGIGTRVCVRDVDGLKPKGSATSAQFCRHSRP